MESIKLAEKLLLHSYYEYQFIDIALTQAIFAFEKALKIRWAEIHGTDSGSNLYGLIDWFFENNYFETWNKDLPHQLRHIRNGKAHEKTNSLGGTAFLHKVYFTIDLINDLYEDPALRLQRWEAFNNLQEVMDSYLKDGGILHYQEKRLIVCRAFPVFLDNKSQNQILSLSVCPIFDLKPFSEDRVFTPKHIQFSLTNWSLDGDVFSGKDVETGSEISISKIADEENKRRFGAWRTEFTSLANWPLYSWIITEPIQDFFTASLRKFHQACQQ